MPSHRKTLLDLTDELDDALKPWTCPQCRKTYQPPVTTYISPIDGREQCEACAGGSRRA
jgi:hypothetical protein